MRKDQTTRLGQLLVERGSVTGEQLIRAIQSQRAVGGRIGTCLLEMDVVSEDGLLEALADQLGVPSAGHETLRGITPDLIALLPKKLAERCLAVPIAATKLELTVATPNVRNLSLLDEIAFATNRRVVPHIANEIRVMEALEKHYGVECPARYAHLLDRLNRSRYLWDDSAKQLFDDLTPGGLEMAPFSDDGVIRAPASLSPRAAGAENHAAATPQPPLSLEELERRLAEENDIQGVGRLLLAYCDRQFTRAALLKVHHGNVLGWLGTGQGLDPDRLDRLEIALKEPSVFFSLGRGADLHLGKMAFSPANRRLVACWHGETPPECVALAVRMRHRFICVLYADRGAQPLDGPSADDLKRLAHKVAMSIEVCLLRRKIASGVQGGGPERPAN